MCCLSGLQSMADSLIRPFMKYPVLDIRKMCPGTLVSLNMFMFSSSTTLPTLFR